MRIRLVEAARALFAAKGFAETGTPEIVRKAEVTRGALYHHFVDKTDLFRAVAKSEARLLALDILAASTEAEDPASAMRAGTEAYFAAMAVPGRALIMLIDGPAVLGVAEMDAIEADSGLATLHDGLAAFLPGSSPDQITALATTLAAAFDRAALAVVDGAEAEDYVEALMRLIGGLKDET